MLTNSNSTQSTQKSHKDLSVTELLDVLKRTTDDSLRSKIYYLLGTFYHDGTNGATKDIEKAIGYLQKSVELDKENAELHFSLGYYSLEKVSEESGNTDGLIDAVLRLVIAYRKGSKNAKTVLDDIAKMNIFAGATNAEEITDFFIRIALNKD